MKVLGVKCGPDKISWALVEGLSRADALVVDSATEVAPISDRGSQLVWLRIEANELLDQCQPDVVSFRLTDPGSLGNSLHRAEVEGVVQEVVGSRRVPVEISFMTSVRSRFAVGTRSELDACLATIPAVESTASSLRDPVIAAVAILPPELPSFSGPPPTIAGPSGC